MMETDRLAALAVAETVAHRARQVVEALREDALDRLAPLLEEIVDGLPELVALAVALNSNAGQQNARRRLG